MPVKRFFTATAALTCLSGIPLTTLGGDSAPAPSLPQTVAADAAELTPEILYEYLVAEIAAGRGMLGISAEAYGDLVRKTKDPRIARRAAEVAFFARQGEAALEAARIWAAAAPDSPDARLTVWFLLAANGHGGELVSSVESHLKSAGKNTSQAILDLGRVIERWPDKQAARNLVDLVTAPYETFAETHYVRAQAANAVRDVEQAQSSIERALAMKPDWEAAILFKAQLSSMETDKTLALLSGYLARHPDARAVRLAHARALVDAKRFAEARREFEQLLAGQADSPELLYSAGLLALQMRDTAVGERYLRDLLDTPFPDKDGVRYYLGHAAELAGREAEAIDWFDAVGARSGHYISARARAASLLRKQGHLDQARQRLQQAALELPKARGDLVLAESRLLLEARQYDEAYRVLEAALADLPDDTTLLYESALLAERNGKYEVLERNLQKLIKLKPEDPMAYNALGYSLADRNIRLDEAQRLIEKALALAPQDPFILDSRGWVAFRRGDGAGALLYLRQALSLSGDPEVSAHLGEVLWSQGLRDEARETWNKALKANPDNEALSATIKRFQP